MASEKGGNYLAFADKLCSERREFGQKIITEDEYRALFSAYDGCKLIGESSPHYLTSDKACAKIQEVRLDAKLVVILRNLIEAIYARYLMRHRDGAIDQEFDTVLDGEERLLETCQGENRLQLSTACYARHLGMYYARFPAAQIKVQLFEDLISDRHRFLYELFSFLGVDPDFAPMGQRHYNKSGITPPGLVRFIMRNRSQLQNSPWRFLPTRVRSYIVGRLSEKLERTPLGRPERERLISLYRDDIRHLETLIDRDLQHWITAQ